jgi:hypothetical protein
MKMNMNMKYISHALIGVVAASLSPLASADNISVKTGYDYSTGKYGTDIETEITSIPFIVNYETGDWIFKTTVPYVKIEGADNVRSGVGAVSSTATSIRSVSGLGDITASAIRTFLLDNQTGFDLTGKIKFGIADSERGLGTGENDYWLLVDVYRRIGTVTYFGGVGYGMLGDSPELQLKNVVSANLGASFKLNEAASVGATFDTRTKSTDRGFAQREVTAFYMHKLDGGYRLQAYALKGFSDGSPDWGGGLNIGYNF